MSESFFDDGPKVNYFILVDGAFPLKLWLMEQYSRCDMDLNQRVLNYRLSRGRRVMENINVPLLDIPEANAARASRRGQGGYGLPSTPQPAEDAIPHRSTGQLCGRWPATNSAGGNDFPHEGRNPLKAAKTQRNILRNYFMTD